jgi:hypothetical protein
MLVLDGAESQHLGLGLVDVVDGHVDVELLGVRRIGPPGRREPLRPLERQRGRHAVGDGDPAVVAVVGDGPAEQRRVELRQDLRFGAVQHYRVHACDSGHVSSSSLKHHQ